ncbi:MAG: hypothetical protein R3C68_07145 [Myxococcota bacterium]
MRWFFGMRTCVGMVAQGLLDLNNKEANVESHHLLMLDIDGLLSNNGVGVVDILRKMLPAVGGDHFDAASLAHLGTPNEISRHALSYKSINAKLRRDYGMTLDEVVDNISWFNNAQEREARMLLNLLKNGLVPTKADGIAYKFADHFSGYLFGIGTE